jgi:hypothetical protein
MEDRDRLRVLSSFWLQRPEDQRTENDLLGFYRWLEQKHPELLQYGQGTPYEQLKVDLRNHIRRE